MAITKRFARILDADKAFDKSTIDALRYQAKAWRLLTFIAIHDPDRAKAEAKWLLMHTFPYVDGEALALYIEERQEMAEEYGVACGALIRRAA